MQDLCVGEGEELLAVLEWDALETGRGRLRKQVLSRRRAQIRTGRARRLDVARRKVLEVKAVLKRKLRRAPQQDCSSNSGRQFVSPGIDCPPGNREAPSGRWSSLVFYPIR